MFALVAAECITTLWAINGPDCLCNVNVCSWFTCTITMMVSWAEIKLILRSISWNFCRGISIWRNHEVVMAWKCYLHYWPFVRGIHQSLVDSPHKEPVTRSLMFPFMLAWAVNKQVNWDILTLNQCCCNVTSISICSLHKSPSKYLLFPVWVTE